MRLYQIEENTTFNMDDNSIISQQNVGRIARTNDYNQGSEEFVVNRKQLNGGENSMNAKHADENQVNTPDPQQYSIPGILHFMQHEWARFELERSQWDVDRAELQAKIAVLLGERKGQESLKSDLIRRIKMLEFALKQERVKFHRLKFGCDPPNINDIKPPSDEPGIGNDVAPDSEVPFSSVSNITWRQGRQLLRQYLQEIGYTDTIIDVRSNRVRLLLGLNNNNAEQDESVSPNINGNDTNKQRTNETQHQQQQQQHQQQHQQQQQQQQQQGRKTPAKKEVPTMAEAMMLDSEAAVMANFAFLARTDVAMSDDDDGDDLDMVTNENDVDMTKVNLLIKDVDAEAEEVINELNLMTESDINTDVHRKTDDNFSISAPESRRVVRSDGVGDGGGVGGGNVVGTAGTDEEVDSSLGLGELAQLTVNNEAEQTYDVSNTNETYRKTWNAKYTLRSHFDGVRALAFHPQEPVLITASEDHTLKLWNLQKTVPAKKSASLDVEPLYTFREHSGPVLCLAMSGDGEQCYSGGSDSAIHCWNLPNANIDPYDQYDPNLMQTTLKGHCDAVWGLSVNNSKGHLLSCSADSTVKLWSPNDTRTPLINTYASEAEGIPTSVDFVRDDIDRIIVAYTSAHCIIYDTETGKPICKLEAAQEINGNTGKFINKVLSHPTLPITITAHEDRHIRFWDNTSGSLIHSMVAHLEPVTSLAIDSNGLYLLSGSHDCSIRLWNFENYTCVQEITAHRKKFDESIFDVAFHPTRPYIASAGADALAKVFV